MGNDFYRAFEERHRGSRELIKERLRVYLPFVEPFKGTGMPLKAFDIGCGRGEWLQIIMESGFEAVGIDLDERMLETCVENGLPERKGDATEALKSMEDESHTVITAFHVVEHMQFEDLQVVVEEAFRVLMPGGLLIMETPNPENIAVATKGFYSDPTHKRPIPPELLSFLVEYHGFKRVKVLRLNEPEDLAVKGSQSLTGVIYGASQDYAVVAQKAASREMLARFDRGFNREYGTKLETLAEKFDQSIFSNIGGIEKKAAEAETRCREVETRLARVEALARKTEDLAREAETRVVSAKARFREAESKVSEAEASAREAESRAMQAETHAREAEHRVWEIRNTLQSVYASWSWRITAPLRRLAGYLITIMSRIRKGVERIALRGANILYKPVIGMMRAFLHRPVLVYQLNRHLMQYPRLYKKLVSVARYTKLLPGIPPGNIPSPAKTGKLEQPDLDHLTPHARKIYRDLKAAIERYRRENG